MREVDEDFKDVKNGYGFIVKIVFIIILLIAAAVGCFSFFKDKNKKNDGQSLKDNYFQAINYDLIKDAVIPNYSNSWSYLLNASERMVTKKALILNLILNDSNYENEEVEILLDFFEDYEERNKVGLNEFKTYFEKIDKVKTMEEFNKVLLDIEYDLNFNPFIVYDVIKDVSDNTKNILAFEQAKMETSYEIYALDKYKAYSDYYHNFRNKILKLYGYDDKKIQEVSKSIDDFVLKIQAKTKVLTDISDKTSLYQYYTIDDIKKDFHNLPILDFLTRFEIDDLDRYIFFDYEHYKYLDQNYTIENLSIFKEMLKLNILEELVPIITTEDYLKVEAELLNDVQGTNLSTEDFKNYIESELKSALVSDELNKRYENVNFTDDNKKEIKDMIDDIKSYYKSMIEKSWLEEETKKEAIKKLDSMKTIIGYQNTEESTYKLVSRKNGGTLLSNVVLMDHIDIEEKFAKLRKEATLQDFDNLEFNAYYSPKDNAIIFPAAFYEVVNGEKDYYKLLGYIGSVIGHEISHAFDDTGSRFDEVGQVRDWWSKNDREKYDELTKKIIEYYNGYSVQGVSVDGKMTLSENIADLAGMKAVLYIAEEKNATKEEYKKIFESYATLWADKITKENLEKSKVIDTHSFNEVRVNAVLSSLDKFYEIYDIDENDDMYVAKEDRVGLW